MSAVLLLAAASLCPESWNPLANALVSFSCAMQVQAFRKVNEYAFSSTMCIGNFRSGVEALCSLRRDARALHRALHYFGVIFLFAAGAGLGSVCIPLFGLKTL